MIHSSNSEKFHEMNLRTSVQEEIKEALKAHDPVKTGTLRFLYAAIVNKEKEKRYAIHKGNPNSTDIELQKKSELSDEEIQQVVAGEAKKRKESIEAFQKGNRQDLVEKEQKELEVLKTYLPEQMDEEELRKLVKDAIAKTGASSAKDMGKVMAFLMPQVKGNADGSLVSNIVQELLK